MSIEDITKERDALAGQLATLTTDHKALADEVAGARKLLGLKKGEDLTDGLKAHLESSGETLALPDLESPEEGGVRRVGLGLGERFVAVEEVAFTNDLGYGKDIVTRRALAAVERALEPMASPAGECANLPTFSPKRFLRVVVEVA